MYPTTVTTLQSVHSDVAASDLATSDGAASHLATWGPPPGRGCSLLITGLPRLHAAPHDVATKDTKIVSSAKHGA